ncbi:transcriptional regulator [Lysinibacillus sp. PLM2]|nr:transcriptional regulator [Lysinibacillus sp. PLM2]
MDIQYIEKQLKAVADANRLKLLACLKKGEVCVCDIVDVLNISQPAVSQHLRKLKEAGIIAERKVGTWKHYRIAEEQTPLMRDILLKIQPLQSCECKSVCCQIEGEVINE